MLLKPILYLAASCACASRAITATGSPGQRTFHTVIAVNDTLYLNGGFPQNTKHASFDLLKLNTSKPFTIAAEDDGLWPWVPIQTTNRGSKLIGHSVVRGINEKSNELLYFGGHDPSEEITDDVVARFDVEKSAWTTIDPNRFRELSGHPEERKSSSHRRRDHTMVGHGTYAYLFGGSEARGSAGISVREHERLRVFSLVENIWLPRFTARGSPVREGHTATMLPGGYMVVLGGRDENDGLVGFERASVLNTKVLTWDTTVVLGGDVPEPRYDHAAVLLSGGTFIFISGGRTARDTYAVDDAVLDTRSWTWKKIKYLGDRRPGPRYGHSMTVLPNEHILYAFGYTQLKETNSAYLLDPLTWTFIDDYTPPPPHRGKMEESKIEEPFAARRFLRGVYRFFSPAH